MVEDGAHFDVVIVGGGVSGALVAWSISNAMKSGDKLARLRVLLLEAGTTLLAPPGNGSEIPGDTAERLAGVHDWSVDDAQLIGSPYNRRNNPFAPTPESDGLRSWYEQAPEHNFRSTYERRWGGTTWHWLGLTPRLVPSDFEMRSRYGVAVDWPISYDDLEPWYAVAERELGVSGDHAQWHEVHGAWRSAPFPMSELWPSYGDEVVRAKLDGATVDGAVVKLRTTPQAKNSRTYQGRPACAGNSSCIPLCPIGAKYDASVHLSRVIADGKITLQARSVVTELREEGGRVRAVTFNDDPADAAARKTVRCDLLVLAGNAIETPRLLLASRLLTSNAHLGANLMDHLNRASYVEASEPVWGYRGPPTTSGIDAFRDGAFRRERAAFRVSVGNDGGGRTRAPQVELASLLASQPTTLVYGRALRTALRERMSRLFRLSCLVEMLPSLANRVTLSSKTDKLGVPRPHLRFDPGEYAITGINRADAILRSLLSRVGNPGSLSPPSAPDLWDGAGHILGTARMGASRADGVVDRDGRAFDLPNLFIADGSVFPTQGTANPTLTIAALALRLGALLVREELGPLARAGRRARRAMTTPRVDTRGELLSLLSDGCEIEHALACAYLYAAMSLKADLVEGGMTWQQQQCVRRWSAQIYFVASQEMLHLAQAWNLLAAVGGAPWIQRGVFPLRVPVAGEVTLESFSLKTLDRFIAFEQHASPMPPPTPGPRESDERFTPRTVGELYALIESGIRFFSEAELFVGADAPQLGPAAAHFPDLVVVRDRATALSAIDRIRAQGEGTNNADLDCHHGIFSAIRHEYDRLQQEDADFSPVRDPANPSTAWAAQSNLFNDVYLLVLRMMAWGYGAAPGDADATPLFAGASIELMVTVLKPVGDMLFLGVGSSTGTVPRKPGPDFSLGRVLALPPPATVASRIVAEQLFDLATRADAGFAEHGWRGTQVSVPLRRLGERFARRATAR